MFIGHFAVGFASKRLAPRVSLPVLLAAPLLLDLLWPVLVLAGVEHVRIVPGDNAFLYLALDDYPWSHSLLMSLVWAAVFGHLVRRATGDVRAGLVVAAGVLSHWVLDWVTHLPDMPLWPGGPELGLALWRSVPGTIVVEATMLAFGVWMYAGATRAKDRVGAIAFWALLVLLAVSYVASAFGPPPPSPTAIGVAAIVGSTLILLWAWWIDRHREVRA